MSEAVLETLLSPTNASRRSSSSTILIGQKASQICELRTHHDALVIPDRELGKKLKSAAGQVRVLVVDSMTSNLLRAIHETPVDLLILTGELGPSHRSAIEKLAPATRFLGPHAELQIGDIRQRVWVLAENREQLIDFKKTGIKAQLWIAPCPRWLPIWVKDGINHNEGPGRADLVGMLSAAMLDPQWIELSKTNVNHDVLVPLGTPEPKITKSKDQKLESLVIAHHLEIRTGAVFPNPQVIELVYRMGRSERAEKSRISPASEKSDRIQSPQLHPEHLVWQQARRALPQIGSQLSMENPWECLDSTPAHLAFLAQRTLVRIREMQQMLRRKYSAPTLELDESIQRSLDVLRRSPETLSEHESKVVLRGFGLEITRQAVANSASRAADFAMKIGFPVALKALSPDLRRKSDVGAVILDVGNGAAVRRAYADILHNIAQYQPTAQIDGVVVAEMVAPGLDIHCGGLRMRNSQFALFARPIGFELPIDPIWGPASSCPDDARRMAFSVLAGLPLPALRRASDPTTHALADVFLRLASLVKHAGSRLMRFDLHPLRIMDAPRKHVVLDATIIQRPHLEGE